MGLEELRAEIERINLEILDILSKRNSIAREIGEYKKKKNLPVEDKEKEKEIFAKIDEESKKLGLNPKFTKNIFTLIVSESKRIQEAIR